MAQQPSAGLRSAVLAGTLSLLLAACGSSGGTSTATTSPPPAGPSATSTSALCSDLDSAQSAFDALAGTEVVKEGTNTLKARLADFQSAMQTLASSAKSEFATEVDAVDAAMAGLRSSVDQLAASPSLADAKAVADALGPVRDSFTALSSAVRSAC